MTQPPGSNPGQPTNRPPSGSGPYGQPPQQPPYGQPPRQPDPYAGGYGQPVQQPAYGGQSGQAGATAWGGAGQSGSKPSALAKAASALAALAALLCLVHGIWSLIFRRGLLADVDDGEDVTADDLSSSDTITNITLWLAVIVALIAVILWIASIVSAKRGAGPLGLAGLALFVVGAALALFGTLNALGGLDDTRASATEGSINDNDTL